MRPVNLIPPESRRGSRAPLRSGSASYVVVAVLAVAVAAVTALVLTANTVTERQNELTALEAEQVQVAAEAQALRPYAEFATMREQRQMTVKALAQSRFDWERVLRELALILPSDVWLVNVSASASPEAQVEGAVEGLRSGATGPALSLVGCGGSQEAVARFAAALEDIDGVTRVGVARSELPDDAQAAASGASDSSDDCRIRDFIARFEITAAFDAVPAPPAADAAAPLPAPASPAPAPAAPAPESAPVESQPVPGVGR